MINKMFGDVKGIFNTLTFIDLITSCIFIVLGLIIYGMPTTADTLVSILVGLLLIANGIAQIIIFYKKESILLYNNNFFYGIILMILGLLAICFKNVLVIFIAIYLIVLGIQKINYSLFLRRFNEYSWIFTGVMGLFFIVFAIVSFLTNREALIQVASICIIAIGLINLINVLLLRRRSQYFIL